MAEFYYRRKVVSNGTSFEILMLFLQKLSACVMNEWSKRFRQAKEERKTGGIRKAQYHYQTVLRQKAWASWLCFHKRKLLLRAPLRRARNHYRKSILRMYLPVIKLNADFLIADFLTSLFICG